MRQPKSEKKMLAGIVLFFAVLWSCAWLWVNVLNGGLEQMPYKFALLLSEAFALVWSVAIFVDGGWG